MSHEIEIKNGKASMMYVGAMPWHGLGVALKSPPTIEKGIELAGLNWTVSCHPMTATVMLDGRAPEEVAAQTRMVVRDSDGKRLSEVGPRWSPLQNLEAFQWFNPFLKSGECSLETAGCLFGGERIWVLAKLNRDPIKVVNDDEINKYLLLSNCHSDKRTARVALTGIRTVCANTEAMAFKDKATKYLSVRHSAKIVDNLNEIRKIVDIANADFTATAEQYRLLAKKQINQELLKKYIKIVFKEDKEPEDKDKTTRKYTVKEDDSRLIENKIIPLFENGKGATLPGVKGTLWAAYNSISEYLTWYAGRTTDARLDSLWFGQNSSFNQRALDVAIEMGKQL